MWRLGHNFIGLKYFVSLAARLMVVLSFLSAPTVFAAPPAKTATTTTTDTNSWDLKTILAYSIDHAPDMKIRRAQNAARALDALSAHRQLWPSLDFNSSHGYEHQYIHHDTDIPELTPWRSNLGLTLTQPIYDNGLASIKSEKADLDIKLAQIEEQNDVEKLKLDVKAAYFNYCNAAISLRVKQEKLTSIRKLQKTTEDQFKSGFKGQQEFLAITADSKRAETDYGNALTQVKELRYTLLQRIGFENSQSPEAPGFKVLTADDSPPPPPSAPLTEPSQGSFGLLSRHRQLNELAASKDQKDLEAIRKKNLPVLDLAAHVGWGSSNYIDTKSSIADNQQLKFDTLLSVTYNIWDGGSRSRDIEAAAKRQEADQLSRQRDFSTDSADFRQTQNALNASYNSYRQASELLLLEQKRSAFMQSEYRQGRAAWLDLDRSLSDLRDAELSRASAYFATLLNRARFDYYLELQKE